MLVVWIWIVVVFKCCVLVCRLVVSLVLCLMSMIWVVLCEVVLKFRVLLLVKVFRMC